MRSWILSILAAVLLSAAVTWFLAGLFHRGAGEHGHTTAAPPETAGCGGGCCGNSR